MLLRHLEHFVAVAEEASFTRAARRLHLAQSGLSMSIQALERELQVSLLVRTPRQVGLTEAGRTLLVKARDVLSSAAEARAAIDALRAAEGRTLSIGVYPYGAFVSVPAVLERFHAAYPDIQLEIKKDYSDVLLEEVRAGRLDIAIATPLTGLPPGVRAIPLAASCFVLACCRRHELASRASLRLDELADLPRIRFHPHEPKTLTPIDQALQSAGLHPPIVCDVNSIQVQLDLVARGLGVALVPQDVGAIAPGLRYIPVSPALSADVVLATMADRRLPCAARALIELFPTLH